MKIVKNIIAEVSGVRLDKYLAEQLGLSRETIKKIIESKEVSVNDTFVRVSHIVKLDDDIKVDAELTTQNLEWIGEDNEEFEKWIVYEDDDILVLDKPVGIITHPGAGNFAGTIANFLLSKEGQEALPRAGIVHRLDKDTSGLMVVAKNLVSYNSLVQMLQIHEVKRTYYALVFGKPKLTGTIEGDIGRDRQNRLKMAVVMGGNEAITHYERLKAWGDKASLLKINLETGRTHQIRVHFSHQGNSLLGDMMYKPRRNQIITAPMHQLSKQMGRQALHATSLAFVHPITNELVSFDSELPEDFRVCMESLDKLLASV